MIKNLIGDHFCEDAYGCDGHGHISKPYETLKLICFLFKVPLFGEMWSKFEETGLFLVKRSKFDKKPFP